MEKEKFQPKEIKEIPFKNLLTLILIVVFLVFIIFLVNFSYSIKKDNQEPSIISTETSNTENVTHGPRQENTENLDPLQKALGFIELYRTENDIGTRIEVLSYVDRYYSIYGWNNRYLVAAPVKDASSGKDTWNLYYFDEELNKTLVYSGLIKDCCGGEIPRIDGRSFRATVISGTGDAGHFAGEKIYINLRNNPTEYIRAEHSFSVDSGKASFGNENKIYAFEEITDTSFECDQDNLNKTINTLGIRAVSDAEEYEKMFDNPIKHTCIGGNPGVYYFDNYFYYSWEGFEYDGSAYLLLFNSKVIERFQFSMSKGFI